MKSNKGFSLVELIVVIAIMAIIAAVAIPVYSTYVDKAETGVAQQAIDDAAYAAKLANIEFGTTAAMTKDDATKTITLTFTGAKALEAVNQVKAIVATTSADSTLTGAGDTATCKLTFTVDTVKNIKLPASI